MKFYNGGGIKWVGIILMQLNLSGLLRVRFCGRCHLPSQTGNGTPGGRRIFNNLLACTVKRGYRYLPGPLEKEIRQPVDLIKLYTNRKAIRFIRVDEGLGHAVC